MNIQRVGKVLVYDTYPSPQLSLLAHYCSGFKESKPFFRKVCQFGRTSYVPRFVAEKKKI